MRLKVEQLEPALEKSLAPVYLIAGDEPLQLGEAADAVRIAARKSGFAVREVISIDSGNEWPSFAAESESLSIFSDKKLIDLRLPSGKPGAEGGKLLVAFCQSPPPDTVLLMTACKIEKASQKSQWFQAIEQTGVVVQVWPLQGSELEQWVRRRAGRRGLSMDPDAIKSLVARIEGNLLAASQEIEKLYILQGSNRITRAMIEADVADSARFDVYALGDELLAGRLRRVLKILRHLKAEGIAPPVIVWSIAKDLRTLIQLQSELRQGMPQETAFRKHAVWENRKPLFQDALKRLRVGHSLALLETTATIDRQIKGQASGDVWEALFDLCVKCCRPEPGF